MELIDQYDMEILYNNGIANVVAYALSRKDVHSTSTLSSLMQLHKEFESMSLNMTRKGDKVSDLLDLLESQR